MSMCKGISRAWAIWWSYYDHMMMIWWSYDDHIMMNLTQSWLPRLVASAFGWPLFHAVKSADLPSIIKKLCKTHTNPWTLSKNVMLVPLQCLFVLCWFFQNSYKPGDVIAAILPASLGESCPIRKAENSFLISERNKCISPPLVKAEVYGWIKIALPSPHLCE